MSRAKAVNKRIKIDDTLIMFVSTGKKKRVSDAAIDAATKLLYQMKVENMIADTDNFYFGERISKTGHACAN
jgi:hypothetical protein